MSRPRPRLRLETRFRRRVLDIRGPAGKMWLRQLPALLDEAAARWSLHLLPPFEPLSYNYVAPAVRADGAQVVLKGGMPHRELFGEIAALRAFDGRGAVRLLDADPDQGLLLLERLQPGTPLDTLNEEQLIPVAIGLMHRLWRPAPADPALTTVARWASGLHRLRARFNNGYGPFPPELVDEAAGLFADLLDAGSDPVLLHGDMHPGNILRSEREPWLVIDPKGVVGDRLYDVATFVCSVPEEEADTGLQRLLLRRASHAAELLGCDRREILAWSFAQSVLSGWWSYEDHGRGWETSFARAAALRSLG
jgi:streptomycin 6-kinase